MVVLGQGDDEKRICGLPNNTRLQAVTGTAISVGSFNMWGFERDLARRAPGIKIHTLDCTIEPKIPPELKGVVQFHKVCLSAKTEVLHGWQYVTWENFTASIGLRQPPYVVKMDIEGFEYQVLESLVQSDPALLPRSISLELHYKTYMTDLPWYGRLKSPYELFMFMQHMLFWGHYVLVDRHDNDLCRSCSEIVLARVLPPGATISPHFIKRLQGNFGSTDGSYVR